MEDKKLNALPDEALDKVAGGAGAGTVIVTCTACRLDGRVTIPSSGPGAEVCPKCGAAIAYNNGKVQYCIAPPPPPAQDHDKDGYWL